LQRRMAGNDGRATEEAALAEDGGTEVAGLSGLQRSILEAPAEMQRGVREILRSPASKNHTAGRELTGVAPAQFWRPQGTRLELDLRKGS
jgi:hypothetical protein